jgi:enoyl-[acyl-carrier protein] reductase I
MRRERSTASARSETDSVDYLGLAHKTILVLGAANKKSVAWHAGQRLSAEGARVIHSVRSEKRRAEIGKLLPSAEIHVCDVEKDGDIERLAEGLERAGTRLDGLVHSIAFADYSAGESGVRAFHETPRADFLRAVDVSCFSLIRLCNALKDRFEPRASVVAISISTTRMAAENYGCMAPVKAALDSSLVFLAKSFSAFSEVRFNSVNAGLLKTSASAGIPGYLESYLFAERATLRKRALKTEEVADAVLFLLSPRSSGVNAQGLVVDAGMGVNYFDREIVERAVRVEHPA